MAGVGSNLILLSLNMASKSFDFTVFRIHIILKKVVSNIKSANLPSK